MIKVFLSFKFCFSDFRTFYRKNLKTIMNSHCVSLDFKRYKNINHLFTKDSLVKKSGALLNSVK